MDRGRKPNHTRTITLNGFECEDGSVELELRLIDAKHFAFEDRERGTLGPGDPVHDIRATMRVGPDMAVSDIEARMDAVPFRFCHGGASHLPELLGKRLDKGWRRAVREAMGGTQGCTHLTELLSQAPTLAFQTMAISQDEAGKSRSELDDARREKPFFLDGCHSWASDSPVSRRYFPQFASDDET